MNIKYSILLVIFHCFCFIVTTGQPQAKNDYIYISGEEYQALLKKDTLLNGAYYVEFKTKMGSYSETPFIIDRYVNNKRDGEYKSGVIRKSNNQIIDTLYSNIINYVNGVKEGYAFYVNEDFGEGYYKKGLKQGVWKEEFGNLNGVIYYTTYQKGIKKGYSEELIHKSGGVFNKDEYVSGFYKENKKTGIWYTSTINCMSIHTYKNGYRHGTYYKYYKQSGLNTDILMGNYSYGKEDGIRKHYNERGELISVDTCNLGVCKPNYITSLLDLDTVNCMNKTFIINIPELDDSSRLDFAKARKEIEILKIAWKEGKKNYTEHIDTFSMTHSSGYLINGLKSGKWIYKNDSCNFQAYINYNNGERHGKYLFKCPQYSVEGCLKHGLKSGKWNYYNALGKLEKNTFYQ